MILWRGEAQIVDAASKSNGREAHMKKLAVVMVIPALAMFVAVGMTSAGGQHWNHWWGIHGTYAMTGAGNCLWSPKPFTPIPPPASPPKDMTDLLTGYWGDPTYSGHFSVQGQMVFRADGKGTAEFTHFGISSPPIIGAPTATFAPSGSLKFHFAFEYHVNRDGTITIAMIPDPGEFQGYASSGPNAGQRFMLDAFTFSGIMSPNYTTLTLTTKNEPQHFTFYGMDGKTLLRDSYGVCNSGRVLIRVSGEHDE